MQKHKAISQKIITLFFLLFPSYYSSLSAQQLTDSRLEYVINKVLTAYNNKTTDSINTYVHPKLGLYYLVKANNVEYWLQRQRICLDPNCVNQTNLPAPYIQLLLEQQLNTEEDNWMVDKKQVHKLTQTIRRFNKASKELTSRELQDIWRMENNSRRVVVSSKSEIWRGNVVFYFSYFDNNWYLSVIDFNN